MQSACRWVDSTILTRRRRDLSGMSGRQASVLAVKKESGSGEILNAEELLLVEPDFLYAEIRLGGEVAEVFETVLVRVLCVDALTLSE